MKVGAIALAPVLGVGGLIYAVTDDEPVLHARVESTTPDYAEPDDTPTPTAESTTPSAEETGSNAPTGTPSPTDDASDDSDDEGSDSSGSEDDASDNDEPSERPIATRPPDEPTTTDEPTPTPSDEPTTTDEPTPTPSDEPTTTDEPTPTPTESEEPLLPGLPLDGREEELVEELAELRAEAGCPDLRLDPRLQAAAREHSEDMRSRWEVSHVNSDGQDTEERAREEGYDAPVGENLAHGGANARRVVDEWSDDGSDRAVMLDCDYRAIGLGVESGLFGSWWTLMLGKD
ncbi:CAP domain-containing protein [Jiangella asiatica]|uniref:SCP domain-containing protein n=1 Tax=Jiangella asiatica TaxID=2530372 RepID=A0A4R5D3W9_9ACTN|nr:CAP domain-containing protein [Jiangella asiatica]TDE07946.1 hypothetical protein E1269_19485 [Jiangella asiatica]